MTTSVVSGRMYFEGTKGVGPVGPVEVAMTMILCFPTMAPSTELVRSLK